jgi:hypothetical protein
MKILKCKLCRGECDVINYERSINKQIRCRGCGYTNEIAHNSSIKEPEVVVIRKRVSQE